MKGLATRMFGIDPRSLALFRVGLASLLLIDLLLRSFNIAEFYTDGGIFPRAQFLEVVRPWHFSIHAMSGSLGWQIILFVAAALAAFFLLVGYRTKWASFFSFLFLASIINRNSIVIQAGDNLLVALTFWAMFLPLGATRSVDAALLPRLKEEPNQTNPLPSFLTLGTVAILLQVLFVYIFTAIFKSGPHWRSEFDAVYWALNIEHYSTSLGLWMTQFPGLLKVFTVMTLVVETGAPYLILCPFLWPHLRTVGLVALFGMHVSFLFFMHLGLFPWIDFVALMLFLPSAFWEKLKAIFPPKPLTIYYDKDCGFCLRMALLIREFFCAHDTQIETCQSDSEIYAVMEKANSWVVKDDQDHLFLRWDGVVRAMRMHALGRWPAKVFSFSFINKAGHGIYKRIANNRHRVGPFFARWLPYRQITIKTHWLVQCVAGAFLVTVFCYNFFGLKKFRHLRPKFITPLMHSVRLDQRWGMFSPKPLVVSFVPQIVGTLRNEKKVNLYPLTEIDEDWQPSNHFYSYYENYRWRKWYERVYLKGHKQASFSMGSALCRNWNRNPKSKQEELARVEIFFVVHKTNDEGNPKEKLRKRKWHHWCFEEFKDKK